jgi:hypothetical protein
VANVDSLLLDPFATNVLIAICHAQNTNRDQETNC